MQSNHLITKSEEGLGRMSAVSSGSSQGSAEVRDPEGSDEPGQSYEAHEHEPMFHMVTQALGDGVLMYASDYPHYESWFPDSVDKIMAWDGIKPETKQKLFWDNANRCFKQR